MSNTSIQQLVRCPDKSYWSNTKWQTRIAHKILLEKACLKEAGQCFSQANVTPLLQQPILKQFGKIGMNQPAFQKVLSGQLTPESPTDPYVPKLFQALQCPTQVKEIPPRSLQEYADSWQKVQELTSSSLSGIHFGHYMARTFNLDILIFNATMADIPLKTGYSPDRWHEGLNVMLEKSPGNFNVEKL